MTSETKLLLVFVSGFAFGIWALISEIPIRLMGGILARLREMDIIIGFLVLPPVWFLGKYLLRLLELLLDLLLAAVDALKRSLSPPGKKLPRGVYVIAPGPRRQKPLVGTIRARTSLTAPVSGRPCIAHLTYLCTEESLGGPILICEASTAECTIELEDGRGVYLPSGRIWLECEEAERIQDRAAVDAYVSALAEELGDRHILPYDYVTQAVIEPGDRVTVRAKT